MIAHITCWIGGTCTAAALEDGNTSKEKCLCVACVPDGLARNLSYTTLHYNQELAKQQQQTHTNSKKKQKDDQPSLHVVHQRRPRGCVCLIGSCSPGQDQTLCQEEWRPNNKE